MSQSIIRQVKAAKRIEKPRPLKLTTQNRPSPVEGLARHNTVEEIMALVEHVSAVLKEGTWDNTLTWNIILLCKNLKTYAQHLETIYKDQLDRAFINFRNGSRDDHLDELSRVFLLEIIELRATGWQGADDLSTYYKSKTNVEIVAPPPDTPSLTQPLLVQTPSPTAPQPPMLSPGEVIKNSGKFAKPTKIPGKNYCKDEVVIRNSDSGKVMGIKGRRVHMIEELSETIISFQRVTPGAKERLVQITGPSEERITYAKQLMEETIRRNASPIRLEQPDKEGGGSSSSLNSSASDESNRFASGIRRSTLLHSLSTSDAHLGEYKHTVTVGNQTIKIFGSNIELVTEAKLVLDEYFNPQKADEYISAFSEEMNMETPVLPSTVSTATSLGTAGQAPGKLSSSSRVDSQESNTTSESEETYKVTTTATSEPVAITDPSNIQPTVVRQATVVRQPLFPDSPKEAFNEAEESDEMGAVSARNRRAFFAQTNLSTQNQQPQQPKESAASVTHAAISGTPIQKLYPMTPKEYAFCTSGFFTLPPVVTRTRFQKSYLMTPKEYAFCTSGFFTVPPVVTPRKTYTREKLLDIALLPLSQEKPEDWNNLVTHGLSKKTVELFDPVVYVQKSIETDGSCAVISATDIDTADLE